MTRIGNNGDRIASQRLDASLFGGSVQRVGHSSPGLGVELRDYVKGNGIAHEDRVLKSADKSAMSLLPLGKGVLVAKWTLTNSATTM